MAQPIVNHKTLIEEINKSGAVDFSKLGEVVGRVTPEMFDPEVADDYIATGVSSVVKIYKMSTGGSELADVDKIKELVKDEGGRLRAGTNER